MTNDVELHRGRGLVLGKFYPPHLGHKYLIDFARAFCAETHIVVGTLQREEIPGALRYAWVREMFPNTTVHHLTDELPQHPDEHPDFWQLWESSLRSLVTDQVDFVFASEEYGVKLAQVLGATFVPVDIARSHVPISGTTIRHDPLRYWELLPPQVQAHFVKRICIFGPESTGKSTLSTDLATALGTRCVREYARVHLERLRTSCTLDDLRIIARGQIASDAALSKQANRLLVCDTDPLATVMWSRWLFGVSPEWLEELAWQHPSDLYILCDVDLPWIPDSVRYLPNARSQQFRECQSLLEEFGRPYEIVTGRGPIRLERALAAVSQRFGKSFGMEGKCSGDHRVMTPLQ